MKKISLLTLSLLLAGAALGPPANAGIDINGINLSNGLQLSNGINLSNGVNLSNGMNLQNGLVRQNGTNFINDGVVNLGRLIVGEILLPAKLEVLLPLHTDERLAPKPAE